jgi:hypothetical protein
MGKIRSVIQDFAEDSPHGRGKRIGQEACCHISVQDAM